MKTSYFTLHYINKQLKMDATLEAIVQGKNEPLWDYIEMFNKEVVQVWEADERMKIYLVEKVSKGKLSICWLI